MKLKDIILNLDKSEKNSDFVDIEQIAAEFGIHQFLQYQDSYRIKAYHFLKWYCTDSYVGGRVYFLDDKPVAISWQSGRKASEEFGWISQELYEETHKYILTLVEEENAKTIDPIDLEEDWGLGHHVDYSGQLLTDTVHYEPSNCIVKVVKKYNNMNEIEKWQLVDIQFADGKKETVPMSDILVPYNLNQKQTS